MSSVSIIAGKLILYCFWIDNYAMQLSAARHTGWLNKLLRYGLGSCVALAVDVGSLWYLTQQLQTNYLAAAAIAFSLGCIVNYTISRLFVFEDRSERQQWLTLVYFTLVGVLGLMLNHVILYLGVSQLGLGLWLTKAVSVMVVFWFNFFLRGKFVFRDLSITEKAS